MLCLTKGIGKANIPNDERIEPVSHEPYAASAIFLKVLSTYITEPDSFRFLLKINFNRFLLIPKWSTQYRPATMSAGITDHCFTNASPPVSSNRKTSAFTRIIAVVTAGKRLGRRDASAKGIIPPTPCSSFSRDTHQLQRRASAAILTPY